MEIIPYNPHTSLVQEHQKKNSDEISKGSENAFVKTPHVEKTLRNEHIMTPIERLHKFFKFDDIPEKERSNFIARIVKLMKKNTHLQYNTKRDFLIIVSYNEILVAIEELNNLFGRVKEYRKNGIHYDAKKEKEDRKVVKNVCNEVFEKGYSLLSLEEPHYDMKLNNLLRELLCVMKKYNEMKPYAL